MTHPKTTLKQFYNSMQQWIDGGCPDHVTHSKDSGLCGNFKSYVLTLPELTKTERNRYYIHIHLDMIEQFKSAGLDFRFPFNEGNLNKFYHEVESQAIYLNLARLKWIKEHAS